MLVPVNVAPWLWGWPHRLQRRLEAAELVRTELAEDDPQQAEINELREKVEAAGMPDAVKKEALRELDRLSKMPVAAAEYTVVPVETTMPSVEVECDLMLAAVAATASRATATNPVIVRCLVISTSYCGPKSP